METQQNEVLIEELHRLQEDYEHVLHLLDEYEVRLSEANCEVKATKLHAQHKPGLWKKFTDKLGLTRHQLHHEILMSGMFDETWYLQHNLDVAHSRIQPLEHYLRFGVREGRNPGPMLDTNWYLSTYPDVQAKKINPLVHYIRYGKREGRQPRKNPLPFTNPAESHQKWLSDALANEKIKSTKLAGQLSRVNDALDSMRALQEQQRLMISSMRSKLKESKLEWEKQQQAVNKLNQENHSLSAMIQNLTTSLKVHESKCERLNQVVAELNLQIANQAQQSQSLLSQNHALSLELQKVSAKLHESEIHCGQLTLRSQQADLTAQSIQAIQLVNKTHLEQHLSELNDLLINKP